MKQQSLLLAAFSSALFATDLMSVVVKLSLIHVHHVVVVVDAIPPPERIPNILARIKRLRRREREKQEQERQQQKKKKLLKCPSGQCLDPNGECAFEAQCFADPCQVQATPCREGEVCEANYCGGCYDVCVPRVGGGIVGQDETIELHEMSGESEDREVSEMSETVDVQILYFDQILDHFAGDGVDGVDEDSAANGDTGGREGDVTTFRQKFFYTDRYVHQPADSEMEARNNNNNDRPSSSSSTRSSTAFLCIGGEGPSLDPSVLINSEHCSGDMIGLAKRLYEEHGWDVHLFALEHRYYGVPLIPSSVSSVGDVSGFSAGKSRDVVALKDGANKHPGYVRGEDSSSSSNSENDRSDDANSDDTDNSNGSRKGVDFTYLSSRQAVRDIANFVTSPEASQLIQREKTSDPSGTSNPPNESESNIPWITFGGSYPGMLSAWTRLLHPSLVVGAVSNSAPVQAKVDFGEYNDRVAKDLEDEMVGGSGECRRIVVEGHEEVVSLLNGGGINGSNGDGDDSGTNDGDDGGEGKSGSNDENIDGVEVVAKLFNVCGGAESLRKDHRNMEVFVGWGLISIGAQENDPSCDTELCNIKGLCDAIVDLHETDPTLTSMEILAKIKSIQNAQYPDDDSSCESVSYEEYISYLSNPTAENSNTRSWMYQTCNEFGFYQTCNMNSECPYGRGYHNVTQDLELCRLVFGIDPERVERSVEGTLKYYGGRDLTPHVVESHQQQFVFDSNGQGILNHVYYGRDGTATLQGQKNLIFVNGNVDPWTELAVTGNWGNKDHPTHNVPGASHHFWTHEVKSTDGKAIYDARQEIYETVSEWLGVEKVGEYDVVAVE